MAKRPSHRPPADGSKKVKKNVAEGIAHIHASFTNTISPLPIAKEHLGVGDLGRRRASRARGKSTRSPPKLPSRPAALAQEWRR